MSHCMINSLFCAAKQAKGTNYASGAFFKNDETYARNASKICQTSGVKNEETEWAERQS